MNQVSIISSQKNSLFGIEEMIAKIVTFPTLKGVACGAPTGHNVLTVPHQSVRVAPGNLIGKASVTGELF
jgi:hypothetical protein